MGAAAALVGLRWTATTEADLGPGRVELRVAVGSEGSTAVALPPLGSITADTHQVPSRLSARIIAIDVEAAQAAAASAATLDDLQREITTDLPGVLRWFALRTTLIAGAVGAVVVLLLPGRRPWHLAPGAVGGMVAVAGLLAATWLPYDLDAFAEPRLEGELSRVPDLVTLAERNLADLEAVRGRIDVVSDRLAELYAASVGELPGGSLGETSILHVSDIHLNPLAAGLVVELATDLDVDAILDTGDLTTFGLPLESRFGEALGDSPVPYYFVPGNHDSPANRRQLGALEGITLIDEETVEVGGVRILGVGDPTFTADNQVSTEEANEQKEATADDVAALVRQEGPDLLAVHDLRQAGESHGLVPVVVAGHTHQRSSDEQEGTLLLTVGSTGATGLGAFLVETTRPYEAQVLRFRDGELVAIDYLTLEGIGGSFILERRLVEPADDTDTQPDDTQPDSDTSAP
ncbi:MAG: metallophosphoesterase family protein [Acidimicrobiales bacterium]